LSANSDSDGASDWVVAVRYIRQREVFYSRPLPLRVLDMEIYDPIPMRFGPQETKVSAHPGGGPGRRFTAMRS